MKQIRNQPEGTTEFINQIQNMQRLADQLSKTIGEFGDTYRDQDTPEEIFPEPPSNIISFPLPVNLGSKGRSAQASVAPTDPFSSWLLAIPGHSLPDDIPDYRPLLQRDGLILLSWDKRITEMGERYTAYWVTSAGISRFYASKPLSPEDFTFAQPDHKSYAAEDGIEFYGQNAPAYIVHVAPELMMSNPSHGELRQEHIQTLKDQGSEVDFNYKYLLKTEKEKNRDLLHKKTKGKDHHQAG